MTIFVSLATYAQPIFQLRSSDKKILVEIKTDPVPAYSVYVDEKSLNEQLNEDIAVQNLSPHSDIICIMIPIKIILSGINFQQIVR